MDHIVLLPHVGSASVHTRNQMGQLVVDNLIAWFSGKGPLTRIWPTNPRAPLPLWATTRVGTARLPEPARYSAIASRNTAAPATERSIRPDMWGRPGPPVTMLPESSGASAPAQFAWKRDNATNVAPLRPRRLACGPTTFDVPPSKRAR